MGCSCQSNSTTAPTFQVVKAGTIMGTYKTQVEAEAAALRQGGAVKRV